uniref:Uncharacterized protein n=1 Tax=Romanomermis culicivorax TaxID=13658 RepID=A0A915IQR9_ROMCU
MPRFDRKTFINCNLVVTVERELLLAENKIFYFEKLNSMEVSRKKYTAYLCIGGRFSRFTEHSATV